MQPACIFTSLILTNLAKSLKDIKSFLIFWYHHIMYLSNTGKPYCYILTILSRAKFIYIQNMLQTNDWNMIGHKY